MNNDSSPTLPADRPLLPNQHHGGDTNIHQSSTQSPEPERRQNDSSSPQSLSLSPSAKEGLTKKLDFLTHLSLNLDTLVYAELCILYYMDCSFFRLLLRWMAQTLFASPKTEDTVLIVPNYHVSAIVAPNLLCMFLHLISSPLQAGEASRGYLHGGILVDFIGQTAPSSRFTLIVLDVVILVIQCFMLTVNIEKERIRAVIKPPRANANTGGVVAVPVTGQDHDSEERGVVRDAPEMDEVNETANVEMRPLGDHTGGGISDSEPAGREGVRFLRQSGVRRHGRLDGFTDVLWSGNAIIGNFHIPRSLRNAWHSTGNTPESAAAYALQNVGYNATLAALAAQRRARLSAAQPRQS
ncbi:DUF1746-domain-containing protein [Xylaria bambusicola]|uniref:DUF1746-domain-containing protein n=1 Tax=Xylaria bambusicola TaxID=326684 RepID=UPI002007947B|nr:DUF1746-domain-containing protein [Xylaria bambusicola]KAI0505566.1 DUF1746-domain-containing protein [Xylaria bambusicola]